jgi:hypothetical protein
MGGSMKEALKLALEALERYQIKRQDFDTFEEADRARKQTKANDRSGLLALKIKRSGPEGHRFVLKSRIDAGLKAQLEEIEEKMVSRNSKKKG